MIRHLRKIITGLLMSVSAIAASAAPKTATLTDVQHALSLPVLENSTNAVTITDGTNSLSLHPGYRRASINGVAVWLNNHAEPDYKNILRISRGDLDHLLVPIFALLSSTVEAGIADTNAVFAADNALPLVFIDPGHGGEDSGAISAKTGLKEKDLVLDISKRLGSRLADKGLNVAYSRTEDVFASLDERSDMAAASNSTIFVSIHANTSASATACGIETFSLALAGCDSTSGDSKISRKEWSGNACDDSNSILGFCIQSAINTARGDADRGLRHARFQVLRRAPCPAVLIECGFLSNASENTSLESARYRERLAAAIAAGIMDFFNSHALKQ